MNGITAGGTKLKKPMYLLTTKRIDGSPLTHSGEGNFLSECFEFVKSITDKKNTHYDKSELAFMKQN